MRAKSPERIEAERLRREEGLSYNEIAARTGVGKSTLSYWLRFIPLAPEHEARLQERLMANRQTFAERAWPINRERHARARRAAYQGGADVAALVPDDHTVHELAFAMLYLGEGTKGHNAVRLASTTPAILKYTLWVLEEVYRVDRARITCRLHLIAAAEHLECSLREWWSQQIELPLERFQKTIYDRRPRTVQLTNDYHGVCSVQCLDTGLQRHILGVANTYVATCLGQDESQSKPA